MKNVKNIPQLSFVTNKDGDMYGLNLWPEVDRYYYQNCALWNTVTKASKIHRTEEVNRLKMLASAAMRRVIDLENQLAEMAAKNPAPPFIQPNVINPADAQ